MSPQKTLIIGQCLAYPTFSGIDLRNWQNVNCFANIGEVGVLELQSNDHRKDKTPPVKLVFWRTSNNSAFICPPQGYK